MAKQQDFSSILKRLAAEYRQDGLEVGNLRDYTATILTRAISRGLLPEHASLMQNEIALALNVSHIPVREALRQLETQGLVNIRNNYGAAVSVMTTAKFQQFVYVRELLEVGALKDAVPLLSAGEIKRAWALLEQMDAQAEGYKIEEINCKFHLSLYEPLNNPLLTEFMEKLYINIARYLGDAFLVKEHLEYSRGEHRELLRACEQKQPQEACKIMSRHLSYVRARVGGGLVAP